MASDAARELPALDPLWRWDDPAASEQAFREAAAAGRAAGERGYEAEAWTQVARAQALQARFDEAHQTLADTVPLLSSEALVPRLRWNLEKGRTLRSSGEPAAARPYFIAAWDLGRQAGQLPLALDAAHMVALVEPPAEALAWAERAIALAEASDDPAARGWLGPLYNNTGWTYFEQGQVETALALWRKGVAVREARGDAGALAIAWWTVARGERARGRHDEALAILRRLDAEAAAAGRPDGYVHEELAENLLALGQPEAATPEFLRAYALLKDEDEVRADLARLERLRTAAGAVG